VQSLSNSPTSKTSTISSFFFYDVPWYNISGLAASSNATHVSVSFGAAPSSPSNLQQGGSTQTLSSLYYLEYSKDAGTTFSMIQNSSATNFTDVFPGAIWEYNTAYVIRVNVQNACGLGRFPATVSFTTPGDTPQTAPTLACPVMTAKNITITWTAIPNTLNDTGGFPVTSYNVYWNSTNWYSKIGSVSSTATLSFTITDVSNPNIPISKYIGF
jgi:hypothetical protein